jgi:hypothetical protein
MGGGTGGSAKATRCGVTSGAAAPRAHRRDGQRDIAPVLMRLLRHHGAAQQLQRRLFVFVASVEPRLVNGPPAGGAGLIGDDDFRRPAALRLDADRYVAGQPALRAAAFALQAADFLVELARFSVGDA